MSDTAAQPEARVPWDRLRFDAVSRAEWSRAAGNGDAPQVSADEIAVLRALGDPVDPQEVDDIYGPLVALLAIRIRAHARAGEQTGALLQRRAPPGPFVVGIAGSVAAGKSTTARLLQVLLARTVEHWDVELVTTDGFLHPNAELERRGLMRRKGFPESYDVAALLRFLADVKRGAEPVAAPRYDHLRYDVLAGERQWVDRPDVLILEGLNVLQTGSGQGGAALPVFVSDFFDFGVYVHADEPSLRRWYVDRFLSLRETAFRREESYFRRLRDLSESEAREAARELWEDINLPNLRENIEPTLPRADLVIEKGVDHRVGRVRLLRG